MKKRLLSLLLILCTLVSVLGTFSISANATTTPSDWAKLEVYTALEEGLVTDELTKDYHRAITREEFCELVMRLYQKITGETVTPEGNPFSDTNNEDIIKAYSLGIVIGISDSEFAPDNFITRQEICVMLTRCIDVAIDDADINVFALNTFADEESIAYWAIDAVNYMYSHNILNGVGENKIDPLGNATCEQAIQLSLRILRAHQRGDFIIPEWVNIYTDFIAINKFNKNTNLYYIGLNDLNFDGIPELILSDSIASAAHSIGILHIQDGEVKLLYGYSHMAGSNDMTNCDFYSNFYDGWLTLRKNVNTGELRYFLLSENGHSDGSFEDTFSFPVNENNEIGLVTEFNHEIILPDEENSSAKDIYYVSGEQVTEEEYLHAKAEFESTWVDTGIRTSAMTEEILKYYNTEYFVATEFLLNLNILFGMYEKEF